MVVVNTTKNYGKVETPHINIKTPDLADQLKGYSPPKPISKVIEDYIAERMIHHDQPDFEGNAFSNFKDQLTKSLGSKKLLRQRRGVAEIKNNFRKNKNRGSSIQKGKVLSRRLQFVLRTWHISMSSLTFLCIAKLTVLRGNDYWISINFLFVFNTPSILTNLCFLLFRGMYV